MDEGENKELEKHILVLQYVRLYKAENEDFDLLYNSVSKNFILRVLSVLSNRIIGSNQTNFKSIANNVIQFNKEYIHLFIIAMRSQNGIKNNYGNNGNKMLQVFDPNNINKRLDSIFPIIFPNINWEDSIDDLFRQTSL